MVHLNVCLIRHLRSRTCREMSRLVCQLALRLAGMGSPECCIVSACSRVAAAAAAAKRQTAGNL